VLVQATSHNVRAYSLRDAEDSGETSVDYEHLAACASLPSSSLVKELRGRNLRSQHVACASLGRPGLYRCSASRSILFFLSPKPSGVAAVPSRPPFSGARFLLGSIPGVNRFFSICFRSLKPLPQTSRQNPKTSAERGFYCLTQTVSTAFLDLISTG